MENKKVIAVFGGSFNPPLNSHFSLAEQIINEYENIEKVMFLPVNSKYNKKGLLSNEHRYNMLKLVCDKNKDFILSDLELKQPVQLATYDTLKLLQKEYPNFKLCFTIGTDNLKTLSNWIKIDDLLEEFSFLVLERDEDNMVEIIEKDEFLFAHKDSFIKLKRNIRSNLSSTFVRDKIKRGKSIRYLTTDEVFYYIKENNLYNL